MTSNDATQAEIARLRQALGLIARLGGAFVEVSDAEGYDGPRSSARLGTSVVDTIAKAASRALEVREP